MNVPDISDYHSSFGRTIREIAESESDPYKKRKLLILASELEIMFNSQANNTQIALGGAEISWHARIDELLDKISDIKNGNVVTHRVVEKISSDVQELSDVTRDQGASVVQLRMEFQAVAETVDNLINDIDVLKKESRKSSREQARISREFIDTIHLVNNLKNQLDGVSSQVKLALQELADRPSSSETKDLVRRFLEVEKIILDTKDYNELRGTTDTTGLERDTSSPDSGGG